MMLMVVYGVITASQTFNVFRDYKDLVFERRVYVGLHVARTFCIVTSLGLMLSQDR